MADYCSGCYRQLVWPAAMGFPAELAEISSAEGGLATDLRWCIAVERSVHTIRVVIVTKFFQLSLQIAGVPEKCMVKIFGANGADQPFDEGMRKRYVGCGFNLLDIQDAKIRLPAVVEE